MAVADLVALDIVLANVHADAASLASIMNDSPTSINVGQAQGTVTTRQGTVVKNVQRSIADIAVSTVAATQANSSKLGLITITNPVDLDSMDIRINALSAAIVLKGAWNASVGVFPTSVSPGESWTVSVAGIVNGIGFNVNDRIVALLHTASTTVYVNNWLKLDYTDQVLSVAGRTGAVTLTVNDLVGFTDNSTNWNTAFTWGSHAAAGYLTAATNARLTDISNITYAAGDMLYYNGTNLVKLAKGVASQVVTMNAAGTLPNWAAGGAQVFIASVDVVNAATVEFTGFDASLYDSYVFDFANIRGSVSTYFQLRTSGNSGATYDIGGSDYAFSESKSALTIRISHGIENTNAIKLSNMVNTLHGWSGRMIVQGPHLLARTRIHGTSTYNYTTYAHAIAFFGGERKSLTAVNAVQFFFASGNIMSGTITMYGVRNA